MNGADNLDFNSRFPIDVQQLSIIANNGLFFLFCDSFVLLKSKTFN